MDSRPVQSTEFQDSHGENLISKKSNLVGVWYISDPQDSASQIVCSTMLFHKASTGKLEINFFCLFLFFDPAASAS